VGVSANHGAPARFGQNFDCRIVSPSFATRRGEVRRHGLDAVGQFTIPRALRRRPEWIVRRMPVGAMRKGSARDLRFPLVKGRPGG